MGCGCRLCKHENSVECQSAYCKCCSQEDHRLEIMIADDKEIDDMLSIKFPRIETA
jgi:hypothetical protein